MNPDEKYIDSILKRFLKNRYVGADDSMFVGNEMVDSLELLTEDERDRFYLAQIRTHHLQNICEDIDMWLLKIEEGRKRLQCVDFIDDL